MAESGKRKYCFQSFVDFYGEQYGLRMWEEAGKTLETPARQDPQPAQKSATKYTKAQFMDFYGAEYGAIMWEKAGDPTDDPRVPALLQHAERIWTRGEGDALKKLKEMHSDIDELADAKGPLTQKNRHRLLAALGPQYWMNGTAKEYFAKGIGEVMAQSLKVYDWEELGKTDVEYKFPTRGVQPPAPKRFMPADMPERLLLCLALDGAGQNAYATSNYREAGRYHGAALQLAEEETAQDSAGSVTDGTWRNEWSIAKSRALDNLGRVARETGKYHVSYNLHARAINTLTEQDLGTFSAHVRPEPLVCIANALSNAGVAKLRSANKDGSRRCHKDAQELRKDLGDLRGYSSTLGNLAKLVPPEEALELYKKSLEIRVELNDTWGVAGSHRSIAVTLQNQKPPDLEGARKHLREALPKFVQVKDMLGIAECLENLALDRIHLAGEKEKPMAATLIGAAIAIRRQKGAAENVVRDHLEQPQFVELMRHHEAEFHQGESMELEAAVGLALKVGVGEHAQ